MASKADKLFLENFGAHITALRKEAGLTQTELATLCDQDRQNFNKIEKGKANATILTLLKVATALDIPLKTITDFKY